MNIISYTNAGKREHGEQHWFWAVWTGVENVSKFDNQEPTESGFTESQKFARRAAWDCIKRHLPNKVDQRAYRRDWSWKYLQHQRSNDERPVFSRCSVDKGKWFWVAVQGLDDAPLARGFAASADAAFEDAVAAVGPVQQGGNWHAEYVRTKEAAINRRDKVSSTSEASSLEFVYECHPHHSDYGEEDFVTKYRIVKRTKKRIYIDREPYRNDPQKSREWYNYDQSTFVLNREEFETTGKASRSRQWWNTYYSDPAIYFAERRSRQHRPECFVKLGLPAGASVEEIQAAYRKLARVTHPDCGGDATEFVQVQAWYEDAMSRLVG